MPFSENYNCQKSCRVARLRSSESHFELNRHLMQQLAIASLDWFMLVPLNCDHILAMTNIKHFDQIRPASHMCQCMHMQQGAQEYEYQLRTYTYYILGVFTSVIFIYQETSDDLTLQQCSVAIYKKAHTSFSNCPGSRIQPSTVDILPHIFTQRSKGRTIEKWTTFLVQR